MIIAYLYVRLISKIWTIIGIWILINTSVINMIVDIFHSWRVIFQHSDLVLYSKDSGQDDRHFDLEQIRLIFLLNII
jgi:hypothetical protein